MIDYPKIGHELAERRRELGISLRGCARAAGIATSTLSEIENNKRTPTLATLERIGDVIGLKFHISLKIKPCKGNDW